MHICFGDRLKGHKGMITCCWFMMKANVLVTRCENYSFFGTYHSQCVLQFKGHVCEILGFRHSALFFDIG